MGRFVEKYVDLLKSGGPSAGLFEATATALRNEGVRLRSAEDFDSETKVIVPQINT